MQRLNVGLVAVSYDPPETLRAFADAHGIAYPLLSDLGSVVIERLGLLDHDLEAHHAHFGMPTADHQRGVAYPVTFLLDEEGRVVQKRIQDNYRAREGGLVLLEKALLIRPPGKGTGVEVAQPRLRLKLSTDGGGYARYQLTRLHVELEVEDGWHIYSAPVPAGYTALEIEVEAEDGVEVGPPEFPQPHDFTVEGLDERFMVHQGSVDVVVPVAFNVGRDRGPVPVRVSVSYQACSASTCLPPARAHLELTVPVIVVG
jgi:hypothetical protein